MDTLTPDTFDAATGEMLDEPARLLLPGGRQEHVDIVEGSTIGQLVSGIPPDLQGMLTVYLHGTEVQPDLWASVHLRAGDRVLLTVTPQGGRGGSGKQILGAILMIVVSIYAPGAGAAIASAAGWGSAAGTAIGIGITMVAGMVISALIAPPTISTGSGANMGATAAKSYAITGQSNQPRPYNVCFAIYGQNKVMPPIATNPDVDNWGSTSTISALYDFGLGYVDFTDLRIGDVAIEQYTPQLVGHWNSYCDDLRLTPTAIGYDQYALNLQ